jgi:hypothetical protein
MAAKKKSKKKNSLKHTPPKKNSKSTKVSKKARKKTTAAKSTAKKRPAVRRAQTSSATEKQNKNKKRAAIKRAKDESSYPVSRPKRAPLTDDDAQGLSAAESADSESVSELVDEGNAFEAGVIRGVEEADNADEREVHTREVSEDDVPEEYLDQD